MGHYMTKEERIILQTLLDEKKTGQLHRPEAGLLPPDGLQRDTARTVSP